MDTAEPTLISVVITNFNYAHYLPACIESVLQQDYPRLEVIVVDDGSTDDSVRVIDRFVPRVTSILRRNGGMPSAMNAGFRAACGDIIVFVDADDFLLPGALAAHARALAVPETVRSQGYMAIVDAQGVPTGRRLPDRPAPDGDLRALVLERGPGAVVSCPNSGNAWSRAALESVFPLQEQPRSVGGEPYMMDAAPLLGRVVTLPQDVAAYRVHSGQMSEGVAGLQPATIEKLTGQLELRRQALARLADLPGADEQWLRRNWRSLTLHHLQHRLGGTRRNPPFLTHLRAAFVAEAGWPKRCALALALAAIRLLPLRAAMLLGGGLIQPRYL